MTLRDIANGIQHEIENLGNTASQDVQKVKRVFTPQPQQQQVQQPRPPVPQHEPIQDFVSWLGNKANNAVQKYTPFANPTSNNGNNFWSSPTASVLAGKTQLPEFNLEPFAAKLPNPVARTGAQIGLGAVDSLLNTPKNLVQAPINVARDVSNGDKNPKHYLADVAPFAEGMLNIGTLGGGSIVKDIAEQGIKKGITQAAKEGAIQGAKYGGAYGTLDAMKSGRNVNSPATYAKNLVIGAGTGAAGGAAGGAALGALTGIPRSVITKAISKIFPDSSVKDVAQKTDQYIQQRFTRNGVGQFAKSDTNQFIPAGRSYAVARQPLKVTHWIDQVDQEIKDKMPQPGLSIKAVDSRKLLPQGEDKSISIPQNENSIKTPLKAEDIITKIDNGNPAVSLTREEQNILANHLRTLNTPENQAMRGVVYKGYGKGKDVVFGVLNNRGYPGRKEYLVMADNGSSDITKGQFRLHSTPIKPSEIVGKINLDNKLPSETPIKGETVGEMQQSTQSPDLTKYENAFNSGDKQTLDQLAAKNPSDARFQVHKQFPSESPTNPSDTFYHGSSREGMNTAIGDGHLGKGLYLTKNVGEARDYAAGWAGGTDPNEYMEVTPQRIKKVQLVNNNLYKTRLTSIDTEKMAQIRKAGYSGVQTPYETMVFDPNDVKVVGHPTDEEFAKTNPSNYPAVEQKPSLKDQILNEPPLPARMSQKAVSEDLNQPQTGKDISVSPQAIYRFKGNLKGNEEPLPWETPGSILKRTKDETPLSQLAGKKEIPNGMRKVAITNTNQIPPDMTASLNDIFNKPDVSVKDKVNALDYLRTPDRVLQKIGLGGHAKDLRTAYENYQKQLPEELNKITQWSKQVSPSANQRIFRYLDGHGSLKDPTELNVANNIKGYLKDWAEKLQLPDDRRITNYITHIFDPDVAKKEFDPEIASLIRDKVAGSVYDPFVQQRLGKLGYKEDTWQALDAYVKRATRKVNMDPALSQIKNAATNLEDSQYSYVKRYIDRVNMRPMEIDNLIDNFIKSTPISYRLGQRPVANISRNIRQAIFRGTLGFNPASALKNLSQGANTYAKLGEKYTVMGYGTLVRKMMSGDQELEKEGILGQDISQDRTINATKKLAEKTDKRMFYLFEMAEKINRGAAYFGAKAKALDQGKSEDFAIQYAKKIVRDTQFNFGSIDTPVAMQSDIGKVLLQFQSYGTKQIEFLSDMAMKKDIAGLIRYSVASLGFAMTVGKLFGMKPTDIIPSVRVGSSPIFTIGTDAVSTATGQPDKYGKQPSVSDRLSKFGTDALPFIPGGSQIKKSIQGFSAVNQAGSYKKNGDLKYTIQQTPENYLRGILFGPNNLPETQDYYNNKGKSSTIAIAPPAANQADAAESVPLGQPPTEIQKAQMKKEVQTINQKEKKILANPSGQNIMGIQIGDKPLSVDQQNSQLSDLEKQKKVLQEQINQKPVSTSTATYMQNGKIKTIDLTPPTSGDGIDAFTNQGWEYTKAREVFKTPLSQGKKNQIYKQLGVDGTKVEYDYKATHSDDIKTQYIVAKAKTESHDSLINDLITGRTTSLSGKQFASNGVLTNLAQGGFISQAEAAYLKKVKADSDGNVIASTASTGRKSAGPKIKIARTTPAAYKYKIAKPKLPNFSFDPFTISSPNVKSKSSIGSFKIQTPKIKKQSISSLSSLKTV